MEKLSVIVPIHNGSKYIKKLYKIINGQTYKNIEIILVENFSQDNSMALLKEIAQNDNRVLILESKEQGTSLARKKGVEHATGKYTVFMDQDDWFNNKYALEKMLETIQATESDICQFSYFRYYGYGIKKKTNAPDKRLFFTKNDIIKKEIASILESSEGYLSCSVWSKIYSTYVLKDAVKNVNFPLYYAEDQFLNVCCFLSEKTEKVCVDTEAYYVWDSRNGFSSSDKAGFALMKDYDVTKPIIHKMLKDVGAGEDVLYRLHLESIYFMVRFLQSRFNENDLEETYKLIKEVNSYNYIKLAKNYMNYELSEEKKYEELRFISSDFTPEEFYEKYKNVDFDIINNVNIFKRILKKFLR